MNCFKIGPITSEVSFGCLRPNTALDLALFLNKTLGWVWSETMTLHQDCPVFVESSISCFRQY